ncbi:hypothetical protein BDK51DRAFT_31181 [Blyttiomyces helicus]|uniref:DNA (cytosine-5-)-methyltransferase n=1 Tax=Blyttiomyces helicus TaxID=388810 RepID=A0A4P9W416_9FUNG|nr:hypothetical protein BDK51DRAFT_31181 [Blyttiomyces helicus]|eukprot:RKO84896.1 hypothetical protein BDK51DRAFT_31181 [Blyttiomyces helicus]
MTDKNLSIMKHVLPGGNWRDVMHLKKVIPKLPPALQKNPEKANSWRKGNVCRIRHPLAGLRRESDWEFADTGLSLHTSAITHPAEDRPLTVREYGLCQGFPATFEFLSKDQTPKQAYCMIGNAVPPPLAYAIGRALLRGWNAHAIKATADPSMDLNTPFWRNLYQLVVSGNDDVDRSREALMRRDDGKDDTAKRYYVTKLRPYQRREAGAPDSGVCSHSKCRFLFLISLAALLALETGINFKLASRKQSVGLIPETSAMEWGPENGLDASSDGSWRGIGKGNG